MGDTHTHTHTHTHNAPNFPTHTHTHTQCPKFPLLCILYLFVVYQSLLNHVQLQPGGHQASLSFTISWSLLKFMSIESVMLMLSNHLILCRSLLLLPSIFPSIGSQRVRHDWVTSLFPASGSFPKSWLFASGGQSIGISASVLQMNIHGWFPLELTSLIFLSKGLSRVFSSTTVQKHQFFSTQPCLWSNSHIHTWLLEKP